MKMFFVALVMLVSVIVFVFANTLYFDSFTDKLSCEIEKLPDSVEAYETSDKYKIKKYENILYDIRRSWNDSETYMSFCMSHSKADSFSTALYGAISFFESNEYSDFLSQITVAKKLLERLRFDENVSFGNLF